MHTVVRQGSSVFGLKGQSSAAERERRTPLEWTTRVGEEIPTRMAISRFTERLIPEDYRYVPLIRAPSTRRDGEPQAP